jgi:hypothetical protein
MSNTTTTLARLRSALGSEFPSFDAVARRLREAGLLPAGGTGGRGDVGSAVLAPDQAALLFLALICGKEPIDAPAAAANLFNAPCVAAFLPLIGPCSRHAVLASECTLGKWLAAEIEHAVNPAHRTAGLYIEPWWITTIDPDVLRDLERSPGDPPVLRDVSVARERLEFRPAVRPLSQSTHDERGRPLSTALSFIVPPELIRTVASAFRERQQQTTILSGGDAA